MTLNVSAAEDSLEAPRVEFVDELKGLAILFMVFIHAAATWQPNNVSSTSPIGIISGGIGGLAAPLFVTLFGWGVSRSTLGVRKIIIRAFILFMAQIILNITANHLFELSTPGVLTLFSLLYITAPAWGKVKNFDLVMQLCILISIASLCILIPQGPLEWDSRVQTLSPIQFLEHLLLTGLYPLFPWIFFAILGAVLASSWNNKQLLIVLFILSLPALILSINQQEVWAIATDPTGQAIMTFFPANHWFLFNSSFGVVLLWYVFENIKFDINSLSRLGKLSLSVYLVHFLPLNVAKDFEDNIQYGNGTIFSVILVYTIIWIFIATIWRKYAHQYTLENFIRKISS